MSGKYDDIINLPHPISKKYPQMSQHNRAAQFSPFAALTGYDAAIRETERITEKKRILSEDTIAEINKNFQIVLEKEFEHPYIQVTYFEADAKREEGIYKTVICRLKRIDIYENILITMDKNKIPIENIVAICLR